MFKEQHERREAGRTEWEMGSASHGGMFVDLGMADKGVSTHGVSL